MSLQQVRRLSRRIRFLRFERIQKFFDRRLIGLDLEGAQKNLAGSLVVSQLSLTGGEEVEQPAVGAPEGHGLFQQLGCQGKVLFVEVGLT